MTAGYMAGGGTTHTQQFIIGMSSNDKNIHDSPPLFRNVMSTPASGTKQRVSGGAIVVVMAAAAGLVLLGWSVGSRTEDTQSLDEHRWWIDSRVIQYRFKHRLWFDFGPRLRLLNIEDKLNFTYLAAACALLSVGLLVRRRHRGALLFASALVGGIVASKGLKPLFGRAIGTSSGGSVFTFPSGHLTLLSGAVIAWILYSTRTSTRVLKVIFGALVVGLYATLLSLTGSHFVTDCIGGLLTSTVFVVSAHEIGRLVFDETAKNVDPSITADLPQ
jgi:hypothetical protein